MLTGRLRQRVALQAKSLAQNSYGEMVETWATAATVYGEVTPRLALARETLADGANQMQARTPYQVRLRYRPGLAPATHRIVWDGRTLEVEAVMDPDGRKRELVLMCYQNL